ncbi:uncharacterized protein ACB058_011755 [Synchiropus picturatus]
MDRYKYFIFRQKRALILGILQIACAGICVICGFMDAAFRKNTPLSVSRTPLWGGLVLASPGLLALFASQRKNSILVLAMVVAAGVACVAAVFVSAYAGLTLTYGEEDEDVFHHHDNPKVTFVLHGLVKGANATILLSCTVSLLLCSLMAYVGSSSLPCCGCYDSRTGLETLVPQFDPGDTELVCTRQAGGDDKLFNTPAQASPAEEDEGERRSSSRLPAYSRLT